MMTADAPLLAKVAVERTLPSFDRLFTYRVPDAMHVAPGCRVRVPFGAGNEARLGVVFAAEPGDPIGCKELLAAVDTEPMLSADALALADWLRETTFCTWFDAARQLLPPGASARSGSLAARLGTLRVRLADRPLSERPLTAKQTAVVALLEELGEAAVREVEYYVGCTRSVLDTLARYGAIVFYERPEAPPPDDEARVPLSALTLTESQRAAADTIMASADRPSLLYGVTGSGKTSVFLDLLGRLAPGESAIVLVPEISLTPQASATFRRYFGGRVALLHSGLTLTERRTAYDRIRRGEADIVLGTRSAVFAPVRNLRLLVVDEEQDGSYKSERAPLYHARDVARFRASQSRACLVLASATPSLESYAAAVEGRWNLITLPERYGDATLPEVTVLDMRDELRSGNPTAFHPMLLGALEANLAAREQSILLLNRRGYHTTLTCLDCGYVVTCPNCSIALTFHLANHRLMCHYCGHSQPIPTACPQCGGAHIRPSGLGTQRAEEQLAKLLPDARVLRMDADTTFTRDAYADSFARFASGDYDILLGTQMVAKGLNFPNATLVGVLSADAALYAQDFRSYERAFALFTQVVGRCGRSVKPGRAYLQTMTPENPIFPLAASQDYPRFFYEEMQNRRLMTYPPFCSFCLLLFTSQREAAAREAAGVFRAIFERDFSRLALPIRLLAANDAELPRLSGRYRLKLLLKYRNTRPFRDALRDTLAEFWKQPASKAVALTVDTSFDGAFS